MLNGTEDTLAIHRAGSAPTRPSCNGCFGRHGLKGGLDMMLFADAVARHLHHLAVVGKSDNTINHATYKFARFEAIMGENRTLDEFKTPKTSWRI